MEGYEHYDLQHEDPYLIPGSTCLKNLLGITETSQLLQAEAEISAAALAELIASPVDPTFELSGFGFEWSGVSGEQMAQACRAARQDKPDYGPLQHLLKICIVRL